ncbi:hypothetical protein GCM10025857_16700 [Alicyclobacillus contaminans]|nr:hypothetical protein GCM10025857_16700 [Alicyclobacillus contaminans]
MKWAVVVFPGSNCDDDAVQAVQSFGDEVHKVWHQERDLSLYDAIILPGDFPTETICAAEPLPASRL